MFDLELPHFGHHVYHYDDPASLYALSQPLSQPLSPLTLLVLPPDRHSSSLSLSQVQSTFLSGGVLRPRAHVIHVCAEDLVWVARRVFLFLWSS